MRKEFACILNYFQISKIERKIHHIPCGASLALKFINLMYLKEHRPF